MNYINLQGHRIYNNKNMNNHIFKINGENTLFHRSQRKIVWFTLPSLQPIHKYYTKSAFISLNSDGSIIVADEGSVTFTTIKIPPLALCQYRKQFIQYHPIGGFSLNHTLVLYQAHSIAFFSKFPTFSKSYIIEVMQQISCVQPSLDETVLGVMVKEKRNTIFIWDLNQFSNKPRQQIEVTDQIIKWQFYLKEMLIILTKSHIRVYYPENQHYNIQFYCEMPNNSIDFCMLERPLTNNHAGRRAVYPVAVLTEGRRLFIYELYDIDKRVKTSIANLLADFQIDNNIQRVISGFEKDNEVIFVFEHRNKRPVVFVANKKFEIIHRKYYLPEISDSIQGLTYRKGYILAEDKENEGNQQKIWKIYQYKNRQQCKLLNGYQSNQAILGNKKLFLFHDTTMCYYSKEKQFHSIESSIQFKSPPNIQLLQEQENHVFFISGIKIFRLDYLDKQIKVAGFTVKNERFKLLEVRTHTRSLLYSVNNQFYLMEYKIQNQKIITKNVRASSERMISLRNGRWAQFNNISIVIGFEDHKLTNFELMKFFKNISSQNNSLYEYKLYWTTHDGLIMLVKNYLFVFQLIEGAEGFNLCLIKRGLTYLHHRFSPDVQDLQVLDPRQIVVREGNRVIKLGSKLGYYVGEDPYSLPDTLLCRQLAMRKHYPPHHPKIMMYLIQLGSFTHISKLLNKIYKWFDSTHSIAFLHNELDVQFFNKYEVQDDERIIISKIEQQQLSQMQKMRNLCQKILENPYRLELQENSSLILQSQIEALIFKEQNSRSIDYYSSIVILQNKIESVINKTKGFESMQIAYMLHSINKDEAIAILKPEVIEWNWLKKFSVVLWYDNKEQLRKWVQQIGGIQYRKQKDPFDCLLWYTIAGKKNILITLFKNHKFNSKEHAGVLAFLQKDFTNPKTFEAAIKNAYALHDKKRYQHSLAFFLLGQQIEEAVNMCINKLKDLNMAYLLCILFNHDPSRVYKTLEEDGDLWCRHMVNFYKARHIDSFNCLFEQQNYQQLQKWDMQLKLTKFHPSVKYFAEMIQKSIPVKRELEEQRLKKQSKNQSNDIFDSFFGEENNEAQIEEVQIPDKQLLPDYQRISEKSATFFLQDQCPELALMIDHNNYKAQRAYDLARFMISKKIKPTVLQIAEQMQDTISIILSKVQNSHSVFNILKQHYQKTIEAYQKLELDELISTDKYIIGTALHFCYLTDQILKNYQTILDNESFEECLLFLEEKVKSVELYGKLLIVLELKEYKLLEEVVNELVLFCEKKMYTTASSEFWATIKASYDRLPEMKKNKSLQVLDDFQQSFYKYSFVKNKAECVNSDLQLNLESSWSVYLKRYIINSVTSIFQGKSEITNHLSFLIKKYNRFFEVWVEDSAKSNLNEQMNMIFTEGPSSKLKLNYLPDFMGQNFEGIAKSISQLRHINKNSAMPFVRISNKIRDKNKQKNDEAIQIFKNKSQGLKSFTINKNQGEGFELGLLFKRGIKKLQVCESLINRNRSQDGLYLVHEDTTYNIEHKIDFDCLFEKKYLPVIEQTLHNIIRNRNEYDGRGILKGSTKRGSIQYFKQLDQIPNIDFNQTNVIQCHHFLPVYLLGGKGCVDICQFAQLKNYNRIKCTGMADIIKISSFDQRVTVLDNSGNLGSYSFDHRITGASVFSVKKANVIDFCTITPTIYCYATNNSIQVVDSLLHPKRQCVFKLPLTQQPISIDSLQQNKVVICRKSDIQIYDFRRDIQQSTREIASISSTLNSSNPHLKSKCMVTDHKSKILVGKNDGNVRIIDYLDKDNDYDVKCSKGLEEPVQNRDKNLCVQEIQIMGSSIVMRTSDGGIYLIDRFD